MRRVLAAPRFWRRLGLAGFSVFGGIAAIGGVLDLFFPGVLAQLSFLFWSGLVASLAFGLWKAYPKSPSVSYSSPRTVIRVVEGDLFSQDAGAHLVVGVSDTFDTAAPHISPASVQGQFLHRVYGNDIAALDRDIGAQLSGLSHHHELLGKAGKVEAYPLGTTITLRLAGRRIFLVAYTAMDVRCSVSATTDGVWNSLSTLWREVRSECNGGTVCVPLVGGGLAKLSPVLPDLDSVRLIVLSFMLAARHQPVCGELRIVVPREQYSKLDLLEVQAFLGSLKR